MKAQITVTSAGGNASGSGGSVSYTTGQIVYTTVSSVNNSVAQGVQQPWEISVVTEIEKAKDISLELSLYPNPSSEFIKLKTGGYDVKNLRFEILDVNGIKLLTGKIYNSETDVFVGNLKPSIITNVTDASAWSIADYPAYCYYNNSNANKDTYGALYNYYAFNEHKLCPVGWYIPGDSEWNELQNYLISNGYNYDGSTSGNKIAKSLASTDSWTVSSVVGTPGNTDYPDKRNATGFTAVPAGYRTFAGVFVNIGNSALFWSSAWASNDYYYTRVIYHNAVDFRKVGLGVNNGLSVRCVKDIKP
ncbi:MAG TPA: fibrobacter succinogenes major paralogous domain-containing protein [Bacteroidales bacterium]|nr:fibrobacter succinogenes major paralogous domain-containing protein [Bacteroidales bacterium]HOK75642.1 fibrobacter succinogenes major paralogous domain-containing protein [Bacteroidales bacterium]HOM41577.1 fibrobacter succinogenes major paralogous domain-containing protein [Bacteroidales bacterium]HPP93603.1 fibrobacter succinogenes major paralogous domain-containing protein [Bacteroidales bacterium]